MTPQTGHSRGGDRSADYFTRSGPSMLHPPLLNNLVVEMMMVMMLVSVVAVESSSTGVMTMHPVAVLSMARNPDPFITRFPICRALVIWAVADFDVEVHCVSGGFHTETHGQHGGGD